MKLVNTYTTKNFAGKITEVNGKKRVEILHEDFYQTEINKFKVGDNVSVNVTSNRPKRTSAQNRYYWNYLTMIGKETGEQEIERLHNLFKGKFLTVGIYEVLGEKVRMTKSTSDLSVSEFIEYIMAIEGMTGIIPPPLENEMGYTFVRK